jgi:hypothetical protein
LIQIEKPQARERLTVFYESISLNTAISGKEFSVRVPASAKRINLAEPSNHHEAATPDK